MPAPNEAALVASLRPKIRALMVVALEDAPSIATDVESMGRNEGNDRLDDAMEAAGFEGMPLEPAKKLSPEKRAIVELIAYRRDGSGALAREEAAAPRSPPIWWGVTILEQWKAPGARRLHHGESRDCRFPESPHQEEAQRAGLWSQTGEDRCRCRRM